MIKQIDLITKNNSTLSSAVDKTLIIDDKIILTMANPHYYVFVCRGKVQTLKYPSAVVECVVHIDHFVILTTDNTIYKSHDGENWELLDLYDGIYPALASEYKRVVGGCVFDTENFINHTNPIGAYPTTCPKYSFGGVMYQTTDDGDNFGLRIINRDFSLGSLCGNCGYNVQPFVYKGYVYILSGTEFLRRSDGDWEVVEFFINDRGTRTKIKRNNVLYFGSSADSKFIYYINASGHVMYSSGGDFAPTYKKSPHSIILSSFISGDKLFTYDTDTFSTNHIECLDMDEFIGMFF